MVCAVHAREIPAPPIGLSDDAVGSFSIAVLRVDGVTCTSCRAEIGSQALSAALGAPRSQLPDHWLDRAIALSGDHTRSDAEKREDAALPNSLTVSDVAKEFLRRIETQPSESVPIGGSSWLRPPDYVSGWTVNCRRTQYTATGAGSVRYYLPCLISTEGELLGPFLEDGDRQGSVWWIVPDDDIELDRLVIGVANLLLMSTFTR